MKHVILPTKLQMFFQAIGALMLTVAIASLACAQPMHTNVALDAAAPAIDLNQQGLSGFWYDAATGGQGVYIAVTIDYSGASEYGVTWFTYDTVAGGEDHQRWYTALSGTVVAGQSNVQLTILQTIFDNLNPPLETDTEPVGNATLSFDTCSSGQLAYTLEFPDGSTRTGNMLLTRMMQNVTCSTTTPYPTNADFALSGNWGPLAVEVNPNSGALFLAWTTFAPWPLLVGAEGQRWYTAQGTFTPGLRSIPVTIYETTGGIFDAPPPAGQQTVVVGTGTMEFLSCTAATFSVNFPGASFGMSGGTLGFGRDNLPPPPGCDLPPLEPSPVPEPRPAPENAH